MLIYLYGLAGSGKDFVGGVLRDSFGFTFYDGDRDLTEELREAIRTEQPFTDAMRDRYYAVIIERIGRLRNDFPFLAFGQATFKERHRRQIMAAYPDVNLVLVTADFALRMERLRRDDRLIPAGYARRIDAYFEPPQHATYRIDNSGTRADMADACLALLSELARTGRC